MASNNIAYTLENNLCTGCGVCESACPRGAISTIVSHGRFIPQIDNNLCYNSKGCHKCYDVCPGINIHFTRLATDIFSDSCTKNDPHVGHYIDCFTGYSNDYDRRFHSASGGMVSEFLIYLLKHNYIDGAVVTKFDNCEPLMVRSYIAKSEKDVLEARSSKYAPVSFHNAIKELKKEEGARYVVVGLPCHIAGLRKAMEFDKILRSKIKGLFAIYCSSGRTFYLTEYILKSRNLNRDSLHYFAYRDEGCLGKMVAITNDRIYKEEYQHYYQPLRSFFIPKRCLFCIDHFGELSDISFGDIHIKPYSDDKIGINSVVTRSRDWHNKLMEAWRSNCIALEPLPIETLKKSQKMAYVKKERNSGFISLNKRLGGIVPQYDNITYSRPTFRICIQYIHNRIQQFIGCHKFLWLLIRFLKAKPNID